ncbi:MAG: hypothetical protein V3T48_08555 [Vicinamibacterales bacterium]
MLLAIYGTIAGGIAVFLALSGAPAPLIPGVAMIVLVAAAALFSSLTVSVSREQISLRFGVGLIRRRFRIGDIRHVGIIRNRWWYGWGVRFTPHGWLYGVSGFDAVRIELTNGRTYNVGTDEPTELLTAIQAAIEQDT